MNGILGLLTLGLASTLATGCGGAGTTPGTNNAGSGTAGAANGSAAGTNGAGGAGVDGVAGGGGEGGDGEVTCHPETDVSPASTSGRAACEAFCAANTCKGTAAACEAYYNCAREDEGSAECVAGSAVYFDCLRAQDDLCNPYACCETQAAAFGDACN